MAFSPDGRSVATASLDGTARIFAVNDGRERARVNHDDNAVQDVAFAPDGKRLGMLSNGLVQIATVKERAVAKQLMLEQPVWAAAFSPDLGYLAVAAWDAGGQRLDEAAWDNGDSHDVLQLVAASGRELSRIDRAGKVTALAFSPDGKRLAAVSNVTKTVRILTVGNGGDPVSIDHDGLVWAIDFSPDGQRLAIAGGDINARVGQVLIVGAEDGRVLDRIPTNAPIHAIAFSPDRQRLAIGIDEDEGDVKTGRKGGSVRILSVANGRELLRVDHRGRVNKLAFSADGSYLAAAAMDLTLQVVRANDGSEVLRLRQGALVDAAAFSPDDQWLAVAGDDGTTQVLAMRDGREIARVTHGGAVFAVSFSRDGKRFATASWDGTAGFWRTDLNDMLRQFCKTEGRNLSLAEWSRFAGDMEWQPTCEDWASRK